jgi:hypothetical protein
MMMLMPNEKPEKSPYLLVLQRGIPKGIVHIGNRIVKITIL